MSTLPKLMVSTPNQKKSRWRRKSAPDASPTFMCCFPVFRRSLKGSGPSLTDTVSTASPLTEDRRYAADENVTVLNTLGVPRKDSRWGRKEGASDWHSCVSNLSYLDDDLDVGLTRARSATVNHTDVSDLKTAGRDWEANAILPEFVKDWPKCSCSFPVHLFETSKEFPLFTPPGMVPDSFEERLLHSHSILGNWVTILERSDSLDPQMQYLGIGKIKRSVMNRLAVPFLAQMEGGDKVLHCQIFTPLGPKHMNAALDGSEMWDDDADVGKWSGIARMVDFHVPWFCNGRPVRAFQLKRNNVKFGECYETRVVLPDKDEGRILLYNLHLFPLDKTKAPIRVDRILKFVKPLDG